MIKPVGQRVVLKVDLSLDKDGNEIVSQEAKVLESNLVDVKKGDTVFFNQFGAVSVNSLKTKKNMVLIVDSEDVYAVLK
jgi:co-chaperonin GroES (HSP10)